MTLLFLSCLLFFLETNWDIKDNLFSPDKFPKQIVKLEFVENWTVTYIMWEWASGFVLLYNDFVYDMSAPVAIQDKT